MLKNLEFESLTKDVAEILSGQSMRFWNNQEQALFLQTAILLSLS